MNCPINKLQSNEYKKLLETIGSVYLQVDVHEWAGAGTGVHKLVYMCVGQRSTPVFIFRSHAPFFLVIGSLTETQGLPIRLHQVAWELHLSPPLG